MRNHSRGTRAVICGFSKPSGAVAAILPFRPDDPLNSAYHKPRLLSGRANPERRLTGQAGGRRDLFRPEHDRHFARLADEMRMLDDGELLKRDPEKNRSADTV
jgi:hypothetical protein